MIQKFITGHYTIGLLLLAANTFLGVKAQVTAYGMYGFPRSTGTYPLTYESAIANKLDYTLPVNNITICTFSSTSTLFFLVNSPGNCINPFTSGPC